MPCKRVTVCTVDEEYIGQFGQKVLVEDAGPAAPDGTFMWPTAIALDQHDNAYVADEWLNRISIFSKDGDWLGKWGTPGEREGELNHPSGLAFGANEQLYLVDNRNNRIQVFTTEGKFLFAWGRQGSAPGEFQLPWGITTDQHGDVYVADWRNDLLQKFTADGQFVLKIGRSRRGDGECKRPTGVAVDQDGFIYVTDFHNDRLQVFDAEGTFVTKLAGEATLSKWGRERVQIDPMMWKERSLAEDLEAREKPFQAPIIQGGIDALWRHDPQVFVAGDLFWYPVQGHPEIRVAPDVLVAFGRPKGDRGSYLQWVEDGITPQVVFEILSPGNTPAEMRRKRLFYQRYGVEESYLYDPDTGALSGWQRQGTTLHAITPMSGWVSPRLGIRFELADDVLHLYHPDGSEFATYVEHAAQREQAQQRAARLAARLRALGLDVDGEAV